MGTNQVSHRSAQNKAQQYLSLLVQFKSDRSSRTAAVDMSDQDLDPLFKTAITSPKCPFATPFALASIALRTRFDLDVHHRTLRIKRPCLSMIKLSLRGLLPT